MRELQHVYQRALDPDGHDSLAKLARLIAPRSRVLDVGCGPGILGGYLCHERDCTVDGVELDAESARIAARSLRNVVVADLETFTFDGLDGPYDYIVCADVLEHLRDPGAVLRRLPSLLADKGRLLLSIPNIGYAGVIAGLMNGEFRYRREGLLDETHLRFFTRRSLTDWLTGLGLFVASLDTVRVEVSESEFQDEHLEAFAPALRDHLLSLEDAMTYQFIVEVVTKPGGERQVPAPSAPAAVTYRTKLHWRGAQPGFDEKRITIARPSMGAERQRIHLPLPPLPSQEVGLRLDPVDRPGFFRLYGLALLDADGTCVWKWDGTRAQLETMPSRALTYVDDAADGQLIVSAENEPWIELPVLHSDTRALTRGGCLEVELSWPQSGDALAIGQRLLQSGLAQALAASDEKRNAALRELTALRDEQQYERVRFERDRDFFERERRRLVDEVRALKRREPADESLLRALVNRLRKLKP